jgi:hypothetical protein
MGFGEGGSEFKREGNGEGKLNEILDEMKKISDEWKKPIGKRNESVREQELPLVQRLKDLTEIPVGRKDEVLSVVEEFAGLADDTKVQPILEKIIERLTSKDYVKEIFLEKVAQGRAGVGREEIAHFEKAARKERKGRKEIYH